MLAHILGGGGQQSRLFSEVREKRGLAYGVSRSLRVYRKAALLVISTASANERVAEALRVVRAELARLRSDGATEQELADAKTYLTRRAGAVARIRRARSPTCCTPCRSTACRAIISTGARP